VDEATKTKDSYDANIAWIAYQLVLDYNSNNHPNKGSKSPTFYLMNRFFFIRSSLSDAPLDMLIYPLF